MNVKDYVKQLSLRSGQTHRGDCPTCFGKGTFTVTNKLGNLVYNCYKASCPVSGTHYKGASLDDLRSILHMESSPADSGHVAFELPESCVMVQDEGGLAGAFMRRYNLDEPYNDGRIDLRLDIKLDRLVFVITDPLTGMTVDAVGRALKQGDKPKWLRYGKSNNCALFVRPASTVLNMSGRLIDATQCAVLVEDSVSACTVSHILTGIAILGTNLPVSLPSVMRTMNIRKVLIALDPDASAKAIDMQRQLCYYFDTKVWLIKDDLKYYSKDRLIGEVGKLI